MGLWLCYEPIKIQFYNNNHRILDMLLLFSVVLSNEDSEETTVLL